MGLFGKIFGAAKGLLGGGGKGSQGYRSPYTGNYENQTGSALSNALGGVTKNKDGSYNFGEGFKNLGGSAGMDYATQGYDFSPMDTAMESYKTSSYKPQAFTFGNAENIDEMANLQYGLGAKDVNRTGAGQLEKLRESVGVRRPGLLMKAGEDSQRNIGEQLAGMNSNIRAAALGQKTQLGKEQQLAQEEQARYGSEDVFRRMQALAEGGQNKISTQSGLTENERKHQQDLMNYLQDMFYKTAGLGNQAAQIQNQKSGNALGALGSIAGVASKFI